MSDNETDDGSLFEDIVGVFSQIVLFFLMFCFAATIHPKSFYRSLKSKGIFIGIALQLVIMPLVGFAIISIVDIGEASTIIFMILLSSPGGAFSNFLNSIFNGDLSLSIAMTTVSTLAAMAFLPFNLYFYLDVLSTSDDSAGAAERLEWGILGRTVAILVSGVGLGLLANKKLPDWDKVFYKIANVAAFGQIILAFMTSNNDSPIWEKPPEVFGVTLVAVVIAMVLSIGVSLSVTMDKPQAFSVIIEVAVQNSSVAIAFAFSSFDGDELSESLAIPVMHGVFTTLFTLIFAVYAFKKGWTYTPEGVTFATAMSGFFQPHPEDFEEPGSHAIADAVEKEKGKNEDASDEDDGSGKDLKGSVASVEKIIEPSSL